MSQDLITVELVHKIGGKLILDPIVLQETSTLTCTAVKWKINSIKMENMKNHILKVIIEQEEVEK